MKEMNPVNRKGQDPVIEQKKWGKVEYLSFPLLANTGIVKEVFTTRIGGVSEGIFSTMNVSYTRGDNVEHVDENFRRIAAIFDGKPDDFVCTDQTHTNHVRKVLEEDRGKGVTRKKGYQDVDGLITNVRGIILATFFADCVPLYFVDPVQKAIGLSHSGWRGTVDKIGLVTINAMCFEYGSNPSDIKCAIGPSICRDCYEVSEDVAMLFNKEAISPKKDNGKYQLDLWKSNEIVLLEAGIKKENIQVTDICTCCNKEYLFSHRASNGKRGNLGAFMQLL